MDAIATSIERLSTGPKFGLGEVVITANCLDRLTEKFGVEIILTLTLLMRRHQCGDWGFNPTIADEWADAETNDQALQNGGRILSAYHLDDEIKVWIITDASRSATTIMLPEDY